MYPNYNDEGGPLQYNMVKSYYNNNCLNLVNQTINYGDCYYGEDLETCCDRVSKSLNIILNSCVNNLEWTCGYTEIENHIIQIELILLALIILIVIFLICACIICIGKRCICEKEINSSEKIPLRFPSIN